MIRRSSLLAAAALAVFAVIGATVVSDQQPLKPPVVVSLERIRATPQFEVVVPIQPAWLRSQAD